MNLLVAELTTLKEKVLDAARLEVSLNLDNQELEKEIKQAKL